MKLLADLRRSLRDGYLRTANCAEHTMGMPALDRRWTAQDVRAITREDRAWPRYELIDGELLVTPAPRYAHQVALSEFHVMLHVYLASNPVGVVLMSPSDLELRPETITQPDVFDTIDRQVGRRQL